MNVDPLAFIVSSWHVAGQFTKLGDIVRAVATLDGCLRVCNRCCVNENATSSTTLSLCSRYLLLTRLRLASLLLVHGRDATAPLSVLLGSNILSSIAQMGMSGASNVTGRLASRVADVAVGSECSASAAMRSSVSGVPKRVRDQAIDGGNPSDDPAVPRPSPLVSRLLAADTHPALWLLFCAYGRANQWLRAGIVAGQASSLVSCCADSHFWAATFAGAVAAAGLLAGFRRLEDSGLGEPNGTVLLLSSVTCSEGTDGVGYGSGFIKFSPVHLLLRSANGLLLHSPCESQMFDFLSLNCQAQTGVYSILDSVFRGLLLWAMFLASVAVPLPLGLEVHGTASAVRTIEVLLQTANKLLRHFALDADADNNGLLKRHSSATSDMQQTVFTMENVPTGATVRLRGHPGSLHSLRSLATFYQDVQSLVSVVCFKLPILRAITLAIHGDGAITAEDEGVGVLPCTAVPKAMNCIFASSPSLRQEFPTQCTVSSSYNESVVPGSVTPVASSPFLEATTLMRRGSLSRKRTRSPPLPDAEQQVSTQVTSITTHSYLGDDVYQVAATQSMSPSSRKRSRLGIATTPPCDEAATANVPKKSCFVKQFLSDQPAIAILRALLRLIAVHVSWSDSLFQDKSGVLVPPTRHVTFPTDRECWPVDPIPCSRIGAHFCIAMPFLDSTGGLLPSEATNDSLLLSPSALFAVSTSRSCLAWRDFAAHNLVGTFSCSWLMGIDCCGAPPSPSVVIIGESLAWLAAAQHVLLQRKRTVPENWSLLLAGVKDCRCHVDGLSFSHWNSSRALLVEDVLGAAVPAVIATAPLQRGIRCVYLSVCTVCFCVAVVSMITLQTLKPPSLRVLSSLAHDLAAALRATASSHDPSSASPANLVDSLCHSLSVLALALGASQATLSAAAMNTAALARNLDLPTISWLLDDLCVLLGAHAVIA